MTEHPAHAAGRRSREAVQAKDKQAWLEVFADDAIVEDPIGPSAFDPEGQGHRARKRSRRSGTRRSPPLTRSSSTSATRSSAATKKPMSATSSSPWANTRSPPKGFHLQG
ncbi:putative ketosteroid isomerase-like protein [Mycobacterium xenopi 4042]|uniref:Putative ketosteroid isomerase-like protein n=1 Tax=Mycobacterium xenopi 4042 TaxID=1299334 RepID=X7ZWB0_MYCXE|nr:putative ketosteroid isomerase-like protein [Mycobacterium xenopi 4042]